MATKARVSLSDFLAMPETKPYKELIDGEIVEKPMPALMHSRMVTRIVAKLVQYLDQSNEGSVDSELRHLDRETAWVFLPDVSVTLHSRRAIVPKESVGPIEILPDFAIEVLSPDDRPGRVPQRITYYMRAGVTLLWLVDPEQERVTIWERGAQPREAVRGETIDAKPVLSEFTLNLDELFDTLHRP